MPKILILVLITLLSLPGFSQEGTTEPSATAQTETPEQPTEIKKEALTPGSGQVIIRGTPDTPDENPEETGISHDPSVNEDATVEEIEAAREKQLEKMQMIQKTTEAVGKPLLNPLGEIQALGHNQLNAAALMDDKVVAILQKMIQEGHMGRISHDALKAQFAEKAKGTFWEKVITKFPALLEIAVEVIRSKEALGGLLGIMARKDDLKTYFYMWLAIFVFGAYFKHRVIKPKWPFLKRMAFSLTISLVLTTASLSIFYNFFSEELSPTISIVAKHI